MKKIIFLTILILLAENASALQVESHLIEIKLDEKAFALIVEKYVLQFDDILEVDYFNEKVQTNSSSVLAWKADFEFFSPRFESPENRLSRSSISYDQPTNTLVFEYELKKPLATILKDEPRETRFSFSGKQLNYFIKEGLIVVPENTTINIFLPENSQFLGHNSSAQIPVQENKVVLSGINTSHLDLQYIIAKPISTKVNSLELIQEFFSNPSNVVIILIALILLVIVFLKKDEISEKIENYVVEHSELEQSEIQEEVELEA